jgi:general secretion pathway protein E
MQQIAQRVLTPIGARSAEDAGRFVATGGGIEQRSVNFLNALFENAIASGASDVHLEMDLIDGTEVRLRRGGTLELLPDVLEPDCARVAKTKICAKAKLDDLERLIPQDGRMMLYMVGRRVDVRVAITPTVSGYKLVMRLLDSSNVRTDIDDLDMPLMVKETMKRLSSQPEGMMLISGPTGSGKTTTLYALLQYLKDETRHIVTIENPVEYAVKSFTQMDVDGNMTFAKAMRASLRLDPDIIMVGEMRDEESASIAQKAGTSGHMVLSTIHANSAAESITRLMAFGVRGFEIAQVLSAVIAQRLVKCISADAVVHWREPNDVEREWLATRNMDYPGIRLPLIFSGGYVGMLPLVEMIEVTAPLRRLLEGGNGDESAWQTQVLEIASEQEQFESLAQAGVRAVLQGKTTLDEVMRCTRESSCIPSSCRWEQILIYRGLLSVECLETARQDIHKARKLGHIVGLQQALIDRGFCTEIQILEAMNMSGQTKKN